MPGALKSLKLRIRARICRRLWTLRHRFQESIPYEKFIMTWTWDMGTLIPNLFPNRFQESIFHPLTRLQIPALSCLPTKTTENGTYEEYYAVLIWICLFVQSFLDVKNPSWIFCIIEKRRHTWTCRSRWQS